MKDQEEITTWECESGIIDSQWGRITQAEWCRREAARFRKAGGSARVAKRTVQKEGYPRREVCVEGGPKQR